MQNRFFPLALSTTILMNSFAYINDVKAQQDPMVDHHHSQPLQSKNTTSFHYLSSDSSLGTENFKKFLETGKFIVDKSLLIKEVVDDSHEVILITRPRRWGKSLNMSMLKHFFNIEVNSKGERIIPNPNRVLFNGGEYSFLAEVEINGKLANQSVTKYLDPLRISEFQDYIGTHQGQYPAILLSLKDVKKDTFEGMKGAIESQIVDLFAQYKYFKSISKLWQDASEDPLMFGKKIRENIIENKDIGVENSLKTLSHWLYEHHGKKTYILIDEYDTPLNQAYIKGYSEKALTLMRGLLGAALKGNSALEKGILTGILRLAKADLFSGLNNPGEYGLLDKEYAQYYGFTEKEVDGLLSKVDHNDFNKEATHKNKKVRHEHGNHDTLLRLKQTLKDYYNGYFVGGEKLYNPWSVVNCISRLEVQPYWVDSGGIDLIKDKLFSKEATNIWESVSDKESLSSKIEKNINVNAINDPESLASLLFHTGYLTRAEEKTSSFLSGENAIKVKIPNEEVKMEFERLLRSYFSENHLPKDDLAALGKVKKTFEFILNQNSTALNTALNTLDSKMEFSKGWNFNFLQIAALTGNQEIFATLLDYDRDLLDGGLGMDFGVADYAALGRTQYNQLKGYHPIVQDPGYLYSGLCSNLGSAIAAGGSGALTGWGVAKLITTLYPPLNLLDFALSWEFIVYSMKYGGVPAAFGAWGGWEIKNYLLNDLTKYCKDYHEYEKVDISRPADIKSLKQYEKYLLENSAAYVVLNGACKGKDTKVTVLAIPAINIEFLPLMALSLTLCSPNPDL